MPQTTQNPVVITAVNQNYLTSARIIAILWVGAGTAADLAELDDPVSGNSLWKGIAAAANNYTALQFAAPGLDAPNGFKCSVLASGNILVYLAKS